MNNVLVAFSLLFSIEYLIRVETLLIQYMMGLRPRLIQYLIGLAETNMPDKKKKKERERENKRIQYSVCKTITN